MRKLFFWAYRTDSTDCLTSAVVAMSGEMALPGKRVTGVHWYHRDWAAAKWHCTYQSTAALR
eukprot:1616441-Rhodomonas_salina.1